MIDEGGGVVSGGNGDRDDGVGGYLEVEMVEWWEEKEMWWLVVEMVKKMVVLMEVLERR